MDASKPGGQFGHDRLALGFAHAPPGCDLAKRAAAANAKPGRAAYGADFNARRGDWSVHFFD